MRLEVNHLTLVVLTLKKVLLFEHLRPVACWLNYRLLRLSLAGLHARYLL